MALAYHPFGLSFSSPGSRVTLCSFMSISVCLNDKSADRFSSSKATTRYSIYRPIPLAWSEEGEGGAHLVAPEETLASSVLPSVPSTQELGDTVVADMVGEWFGIGPVQWGAEGEEAHGVEPRPGRPVAARA